MSSDKRRHFNKRPFGKKKKRQTNKQKGRKKERKEALKVRCANNPVQIGNSKK